MSVWNIALGRLREDVNLAQRDAQSFAVGSIGARSESQRVAEAAFC